MCDYKIYKTSGWDQGRTVVSRSKGFKVIFFSNAALDSDYYEYDFEHVTVDQIKTALKRHYSKKSSRVNIFEYEVSRFSNDGLRSRRFDLFSIEPKKRNIIIYEIKSGRRDFVTDKKWRTYLKYCNQFVFVCPKDAIDKKELPKDTGLMYAFRYRRRAIDEQDKTNWWTGLQLVKHSEKRIIDKNMYIELLEHTIIKLKYREAF